MIDALQASTPSNLAVRVTRLYVPSKGSSGPIGGLLAPRSASASRAPATPRRGGIVWHGIVCRNGGMRNGHQEMASCGEGGRKIARDQEMAWNRV